MDARDPYSTVLTLAEEAMVVEFLRRTIPPLDDDLGCLREAIPTLTRSSLHRCPERHGNSRLPHGEEGWNAGTRVPTTIGYVHIDHRELRLADGNLHMFLAIDRVSKFAYLNSTIAPRC